MYKIWQPMKYATTKKPEVLKAALVSDNYCLQLKKDGSSYVLAKDTDGSVHLYGDRLSKKDGKIIDKIENVPHIKDWAEVYLPKESQLCVEICYGVESKTVNTIMLALPQKAIERQKQNGVVRVYIFDFLYWDGQELYKEDFGVRWNLGSGYFKVFQRAGTIPPWMTLAETVYENKDVAIQEWLSNGEEGGVLKLLTSTSKTSAAHAVREIGETAARPMHTTYKIKQVDTVDVVITSVEMPTSEYTGKNPETHAYKDEDGNPINRLYALGYANSIGIGAYKNGVIIPIGTVASGLDDDLREDLAQNWSKYIGQVCEVSCMQINSKEGSLRHPRFVRMRPDKSAEQCEWGDIFASDN